MAETRSAPRTWTPHETDPIGAQYAFEKRVVKAGGVVPRSDVLLLEAIEDELDLPRPGRSWPIAQSERELKSGRGLDLDGR